MNFQEWEAEVQRRIGINEGYSSTVYMDSASPPNPTIGVGFNLNRSDARQALGEHRSRLQRGSQRHRAHAVNR